ncbi:F0F1 ATP synthase subunit A [Actinospongicola halichondriae]|uniref:F0F1 ATP synthase subunit A n=1 Tax=Actinospongicola halichondriae TaxID=3236844 RepID=UPI003D5940EC
MIPTMPVFSLEFPPLTHIVQWPAFLFEDTAFAINKVVLIYFFAVIMTMALFILGNKKQLVPSGAQNIAETSVTFIDDIVLQTMGTEGRKYTPFLMSIFFFVFFTNIFEIVPVIQMPASARVALPMLLALTVWFVFIIVGIINQGPIGYFKNALFPPGVPPALYILVAPIEFVSTFLVRPFSLMVRLFANLLAGHILLVTFAVLSSGLVIGKWYAVFLPLPVFAVIFFTAFEVLVSFLQAYVFALLTGVYIGSSLHAEH